MPEFRAPCMAPADTPDVRPIFKASCVLMPPSLPMPAAMTPVEKPVFKALPARPGMYLPTAARGLVPMMVPPPPTYPMAPEIKASLSEPPPARVTAPEASAVVPALPRNAPMAVGPRTVASATVAMIRPMGLFAIFLTTLATDLKAFPMALKAFFMKNSGRPVTGLIVPEPPRLRSSSASSGVMCASMLSPFRPWEARYEATSARPPSAMPIGASPSTVGDICMGSMAPWPRIDCISLSTTRSMPMNSGSYWSGRSPGSTMPSWINC